MFYDNETEIPQLHELLPNPFTHTHNPNDFFESNTDTMQQLGTRFCNISLQDFSPLC